MTPTQYNRINELLAEYSELSSTLTTIEASVNKSQIAAARPMLPDHANTTARLGEIEGRLKEIAIANPELFPDDKRTHKTPFGSVSFRKSKFLEYADEEKVILQIKLACTKELSRAHNQARPPLFTEETLLRTIEQPNKEALELLSDAQLAQFGITRKTEETFNVKPLEVKADKLRKADKPELN